MPTSSGRPDLSPAPSTTPLDSQEQLFRSIFDAIEPGIFVIEVLFDPAGRPADYRLLAANAAYAKQSGLAATLGKTRRELSPDHEEHWFELYGRIALTGEPLHFVNEARALGRWFEVHAFRIGGPDSRLVAGLFTDITARRRAEEALRDSLLEDALRLSEARLQFALKAGRMGTWELDLESGRLVASPTCKANYGRAPDEPFSYDDLTAAILDQDRPGWTRRLAAATEQAADFDLESRARWPDGSTHWVQVRGSCATNQQGRAIALSGVSILIDDRKRVEEELKAADRQKDEFLATASHELRTPLNAILGWARLLRSGQLDPSGYLRGIETIERNARSQVQLIEDILDGSRIITGKLHLEIRPLDLTVLVNAALDAIRPAAEAKRIALSVAVDPEAARIMGDPERLQQVVWNLANNAIKFTPKGGYVAVRLERAGASVELTIEDSGQGIRADFLPHVFERFRQAEGSTTRRHGGLGLGLALVHHLVEAHGGTVRAESAGEGRGAKFIVTLPIQAIPPQAVEAEPHRASSPSDPGLPASRLDGVTVLVVDDEADARDLVATVLRANGAEVTTAPTAERGLELIAQLSPMVLVSDIGMPEVDGYELIRRVRTLTGLQGARLAAIALTAYAREEDRRRALEAGFQTHVAKPVEPAELVRVVASLAQTLGRESTPPGYDPTIGRADPLAKFDTILATQGVRAALRFLNCRTSHRFTGLYCFDPPWVRNLLLVDSSDPQIERGPDLPASEAYCSIIGDSQQSFTTEDTRRDDRLRDHPLRDKILSYCGVIVRDESGQIFGTLCHYDLVPCEVPVAEMSLLEAVAPRLLRALRAAPLPPDPDGPPPAPGGPGPA